MFQSPDDDIKLDALFAAPLESTNVGMIVGVTFAVLVTLLLLVILLLFYKHRQKNQTRYRIHKAEPVHVIYDPIRAVDNVYQPTPTHGFLLRDRI